jgi:hypothetical protein
MSIVIVLLLVLVLVLDVPGFFRRCQAPDLLCPTLHLTLSLLGARFTPSGAVLR